MANFSIPLESRVRLKEAGADIYSFAVAGAEAVIKDHKIDPVGDYPMVFVEWDRDHWAYNDEPNQWTFESHFEIIEEGSTVSKKSSDDILRGIAGLIGEYLSDVDNDQGKTQESTAPTPDTADSPDEFIETIGNAHERATEADAFILISINEERDQAGNDIMVPYVYSSHRNDIAGVLLHAQVAAFAAAAHREAALEIIQRRRAS